MMVNAITKSGTNTPSGTFSGYFRDDQFNAKDLIQNRVLPYSNQQISGTFGGPILRDRIHFFGNWEYEREPSTVTFISRYPAFNIDLPGNRTENKAGPKVDWQFTPQTRLTPAVQPLPGEDSEHRDGRGERCTRRRGRQDQRIANQFFGDFTQVLNARSLNSVKVGVGVPALPAASRTPDGARRATGGRRVRRACTGTCSAARRSTAACRCWRSRATSFGNTNNPQSSGEKVYSLRDDFTTSFNCGGRHDMQDRRRIHPLHDGHGVVQQLQRATRIQRRAAREHRAADSGVGRRVHVEPARAVAAGARLHRGDRRLRLGHQAEHLCRLAPGRLGDQQPADGEPGRPLRHRPRRARRGRSCSSRGCRASGRTT